MTNTKKNRPATANEIAKYMLWDAMQTRIEFIGESHFAEGKSEEYIDEMLRHAEKHANSFYKHHNLQDINY